MTEPKPDPDENKLDSFPTPSSTTTHSLKLAPGPLAYRAETGWITLRKIHEPVAHIFHTAYLVEPSTTTRPLTFVFNGGPGAASAYLHMGALGPQRVAFGPMGKVPEPPTRVVDNYETWLSFTDLVFIDPVGTGFSRALVKHGLEKKKKESTTKPDESSKPDSEGPKENPEFWEIDKDLDSLGEFIARFLSKHHRWVSPLFIAGESYGGFRVAKMARKLQERHGVGLCGALLISPALELESLSGTDYDLTYWVELFPSLAAAAHHHGRVRNGGDTNAVRERAEAFAVSDFTRWLALGERMPTAERSRTVATMSDLLGLSPAILERAGGRITSTLFCRELLRSERRLCGHYDASITAVDPFPDRDNYEGPDPTLYSIDRLFTGAINHQLRTNLQVESDLEYRLLSMQVNEAWKDRSKSHFFHKLAGAMDDLRYGMSLNEHMKVFISHGYFDLVTPYFSSQRLIHLMKLTSEQQRNLVNRNFDGGHMFYSWDESRAAFQSQAQQFYESAIHVFEPR